jgi:hypothetical protein
MFKKIILYLSDQTPTRQIRHLNIILFVLITILVAYTVFFVESTDIFKSRESSLPPQIVLVHSDTGTNILNNTNNTYLVPVLKKETGDQLTTKDYLNDTQNLLDKFSVGDVVIIKYFQIPGVVIKTENVLSSQKISILYKDNLRALHVIDLDKKFLMRPGVGIIHIHEWDLSK